MGRLFGIVFFLCFLAACAHTRPEKLPGETDLEVARVSIVANDKSEDVDFTPLFPKLGSRSANALYTARRYNPVRVAEDRRRVATYLQSLGWFDATVDEPKVYVDEKHQRVEIDITYTKGARYALDGVEIRGAPSGTESILDGRIRSRAGDSYDLEVMRVARYDMAGDLQRHGYGHAKVYVRTYVDRNKHTIHVVYFADPGPATKIGKITIEGRKKVDEGDIRERLGLASGETYSLERKEKAEIDLYDTGAFAQVVVETNADVETYFGDVPDSGGLLGPERTNDDGTLKPRDLSDTIDLVVHVDESPTAKVRLRATVEADPTRGDATAGAELQLRNVFGSQHHLLVRGRLGYGVLFGDDVDTPNGLYGDALVRYTRPSLIGRLVDGRLSVRFRDVLYPGFHMRELFAGPGIRSTLARDVFVETDVGFRLGQQVDFGNFDPVARARFALADDNTSRGAQIEGALVWDGRNDPVEPTRGHLLALRMVGSPGGALATNRYGVAAPEARGYVPLSENVSIGVRASGGWVFGWDDAGVPLGPRLFGGGAWGHRGFGRERLSPLAPSDCVANLTVGAPPVCKNEFVGGLSLVETSAELRFLPPNKQAGLVFFVDLGGAGTRANPFESGVSMAAGIGPRLRLWYFPIAVDLAHQFLQNGIVANHRFLVFARIGEAF